MINLKQVCFSIKQAKLLHPTDLIIHPNEFVVIMGPNGAGKSTLLKLMSGQLKATQGELLFDNFPIQQIDKISLAKKRAVLSQHYQISFPLSAKEIVMMGRFPYFKHLPSAKDKDLVKSLMEQLGVSHLMERSYATLSGGEAQKVQMCRVLAQLNNDSNENSLMLLDEPVSHLDIHYQHLLLGIARQWLAPNKSVVAVLHDINLALKYADRILFLKNGYLVNQYTKGQSFPIDIIQTIFDVSAISLDLPSSERQWIAF
jgi:iron complex transport system ATP-binding protein